MSKCSSLRGSVERLLKGVREVHKDLTTASKRLDNAITRYAVLVIHLSRLLSMLKAEGLISDEEYEELMKEFGGWRL